MKIITKPFAFIATLAAVCCLQAADPQSTGRAIAILDVETDDPAAYATLMAKYNEAAKAKLNIDNYVRIYQSLYDGRGTGRVRAVSGAASISELMKNAATLEADPAIMALTEKMKSMRKRGPRVLYHSVRYEGVNAKGAWNYNTLAVVNDEAGYLKAIDDLRGIFDANGLKDVKIAVYRVAAGRADHTHRITINANSSERLGAFLDAASTNPQLQKWQADSAKLRTVVATTTSREITK
jgi:hypothetical protein